MAKPTSVKSASVRRARKENSSSFALWLIIISILVVGVVVGVIVYNNRPISTPVAAPDVPAAWVNRNTLGNPEAKVVVQAWEDFLCPHCREWTEQIEPNLFKDYIKAGKVRLEFMPFPLQGFEPGSSLGALASECAADQNAFWPYHDRLFQVAGQQGMSGFTAENLIGYAASLGLDRQKFTQCMNSPQHQNDIKASMTQGTSLGLQGTPYIVLNGKPVTNSFDYTALKAQIDGLLSAQTGK